MSGRLIAHRYAKALLQIGEKQGTLAALKDELLAVDTLVRGNADLERLCLYPLLAPSKKAEALDQVLALARVSDTLRKFFRVVAQAARLYLVHDIATAFGELVDQRMGIQEAQVLSAHPMSSAQELDLSRALAHRTGKTIRLRTRQDASLLGGLRIQVGSTVYDASLLGQLGQLKARLLSA